jgi:short subunit dehydrogenase
MAEPMKSLAAAAFGGYLRALAPVDLPARVTILQGEDMGCPSLLVDLAAGHVRVVPPRDRRPGRAQAIDDFTAVVAAPSTGPDVMSTDFAGHGVVVPGAPQGIGASIAAYFVARQATVVLMDLDGDLAAQTAAAFGGGAHAVAGDVSRRADVQRAVRACAERPATWMSWWRTPGSPAWYWIGLQPGIST